MSGYTRQSVADIIPTAVVRAAPINAELNALRDAFDFDSTGSTGHKHDGTADEGSYVPLIADLDGLNKVAIDTTHNYVQFFVEVSSAAVEQIRIQDGVIIPTSDNDIDLGTTTVEFKNLYLDGTAKIDTLTVDENATVTGNLTVNGNTFIGDSNTDTVTVTADVASALIPSADSTYPLGDSSNYWSAAFIDAITTTGNINTGGNLAVTGTSTFTGTLTTNGNTVIGSDGSDTVTVNADVASHLIPSADSTYTLGDTSNYWSHGYIDAITTTGNITVGGTLTVTSTIDMTSDKIINLGAPTSANDAATKTYVDTAISNLVASAPGTLDTLNELAAALGNDPNFATTVTNSIATKVSKAGDTMSGDLAMGSNKITGLGTPTSGNDATNKTYVDGILGSATSAAASAAAAAASASAAASSYDSFDDRYLGAKGSEPSLDNDGNALLTGALYFNTSSNKMRVYDGAAWRDAGSSVNGTAERFVYTATASQTTFSANYDVGFVDVYMNGVKLVAGTDFTATSGTSIVLATGATSGDIIDIIGYGAFSVANTYTQAAADAKFLISANNFSDINNAATALQNLGLTATAAEVNLIDGSAANTVVNNKAVIYGASGEVTANQIDILAQGDLRLQDTTGGQYVALQAPSTVSSSFTLTLPTADGTNGQVLQTNGSGALSFTTISASPFSDNTLLAQIQAISLSF